MNHAMNDQGFYDIYPLWHVPFWQTSWFFWSIICLIIVVVLGLGYALYKRFFAKKAQPLNPWQKALQELEALENLDVTNPENGKQFYLQLTAILKQYLQDRFQFPLVGKTDEEMVSYLRDSEIEKKYKISEICNGCVLIKFANQSAIADQTNSHLQMAIKLITDTVPEKKD